MNGCGEMSYFGLVLPSHPVVWRQNSLPSPYLPFFHLFLFIFYLVGCFPMEELSSSNHTGTLLCRLAYQSLWLHGFSWNIFLGFFSHISLFSKLGYLILQWLIVFPSFFPRVHGCTTRINEFKWNEVNWWSEINFILVSHSFDSIPCSVYVTVFYHSIFKLSANHNVAELPPPLPHRQNKNGNLPP